MHTERPPLEYDLHTLAGIGYHLAVGIDLDRYDPRAPTLAWYTVDVPPAGPGQPPHVEWFASQAEAIAHAVNRLLAENEAETGTPEPANLVAVSKRERMLVAECLARMDPDTLNDDLAFRGVEETSGAELDTLAARFANTAEVAP